jgi:hypothetical protein
MNTIRDIKKALKSDGIIKVNNLEITLDNLNNCEVSKDGEFVFSCSSWWELDEFLLDEGFTVYPVQ